MGLQKIGIRTAGYAALVLGERAAGDVYALATFRRADDPRPRSTRCSRNGAFNRCLRRRRAAAGAAAVRPLLVAG